MRCLWLQSRDRNTYFFHKQANRIEQRNNVSEIPNSQEKQTIEFEDIKAKSNESFKQLYIDLGTKTLGNHDEMLQNIPKIIRNE